MFGKCWCVDTSESLKARRVYSARFPAYQEYFEALSRTERKASAYGFYGFRPERIKILDEKAFGEEVFVLAEVVRF